MHSLLNPDPVATLAQAHSCKCKPGRPHTIRGMLRVRYSEIVEAISSPTDQQIHLKVGEELLYALDWQRLGQWFFR